MNLYRPQFAYPPARGFKEETFHCTFDSQNTPILGTAIAGGARVNDIMLQLQNDYEFASRGIKVQTDSGASNFYLWLRDPFGNYLSQVPVPLSLYATGAGSLPIIGTFIVDLNPEIVCPAGGVWTAYLYNPTVGSLTPPKFSFYGVNRCAIGRAA
jgi:hypothetical protein